MALVLADRVLETTTTAGSGTITLAGAEPGYQSFSAVGDGNQTYYTIAGDTEWEVGVGTYTASGTTLSRDTVLSSSDSGSKVGFSAGIKKVFVTYPSEKSVNRDVSGNISASTGKIINLAEPTDSADAATKLYVDTLAAQGITYHSPVKYEVPNTTGNLTATYNNGTAGVSATLTNAGTLAAFVPDGVTATISDRILVYSQTNAFENGVYTVTVVGDGSTSWVLTRATDADTYALKSPNSLGAGDAFYVTSGNTGAGETYLCNTSGVITFGTTPINFVQISAAQVYSAGNGLSLTNTTFSLATPVAVSNGGTGTSATPTNGQLLIGNGSNYTLATLTAGSGVSITNSAGSITLSATGSGGTVTAVTATGPLASTGGTTPDISIANSTGTGSVVLDNGPIIYSATITGAVSASITTITGTSANITNVSGTNLSYGSATITNLLGTTLTISGNTFLATSGGNVGIGTTSTSDAGVVITPSVTRDGNWDAKLALQSTANADYPALLFSGCSGTQRYGAIVQATSTSGNDSTLQTATIEFLNSSATAGNIVFKTNNAVGTGAPAERFRIAADGNVGIGAAAPGATGFTSFLALGNNNAGIGNAGTNIIGIVTNNAERMRIDSSGNVGIRTASPSTALQVSGTITGTAGSFGSANITTLTGTNLSYGSATITTGNLTFSGTGQRITGDMSNATVANRLAFQTSTANSNTSVAAIPNGTATQSAFNTFNASDPTNSSIMQLICATADSRLAAGITGTGTYLPMTFYTGGSERMRLDTSGNLGIAKTSPSLTLDVSGTIGDLAGNVRNIPSAGSTKTSSYTLATTDNGEHVTVGSGGSITVPNSTFSAGNAITIYNDTTGNVSINISLTTCYVAGTNTNRSGVTLATRGVATILFISGTYGVISGNVT